MAEGGEGPLKGWVSSGLSKAHIYMASKDGRLKVAIPGIGALKEGTLLAILAEAGLTKEEFLELLE